MARIDGDVRDVIHWDSTFQDCNKESLYISIINSFDVTSSNVYFYYRDYLGSLRFVLNGDIIEHTIDYLPYDERAYELKNIDISPSSGIPFEDNNDGYKYEGLGYTGYIYNDKSKMYYAKNRYYSPSRGGFNRVDPIRDGHNWYGYCNGDPVNNTDPWGLNTIGIASSGVTMAVAVAIEKLIGTALLALAEPSFIGEVALALLAGYLIADLYARYGKEGVVKFLSEVKKKAPQIYESIKEQAENVINSIVGKSKSEPEENKDVINGSEDQEILTGAIPGNSLVDEDGKYDTEKVEKFLGNWKEVYTGGDLTLSGVEDWIERNKMKKREENKKSPKSKIWDFMDDLPYSEALEEALKLIEDLLGGKIKPSKIIKNKKGETVIIWNIGKITIILRTTSTSNTVTIQIQGLLKKDIKIRVGRPNPKKSKKGKDNSLTKSNYIRNNKNCKILVNKLRFKNYK